eukprot:4778888-Ditylum_brightwellii.AAC.1
MVDPMSEEELRDYYRKMGMKMRRTPSIFKNRKGRSSSSASGSKAVGAASNVASNSSKKEEGSISNSSGRTRQGLDRKA